MADLICGDTGRRVRQKRVRLEFFSAPGFPEAFRQFDETDGFPYSMAAAPAGRIVL